MIENGGGDVVGDIADEFVRGFWRNELEDVLVENGDVSLCF